MTFVAGWYTGAGESALTKGDDAMRTGKYLNDAAKAMDDVKPWLRNAAREPALCLGWHRFRDQLLLDLAGRQGRVHRTRIRHAATEGVSEQLARTRAPSASCRAHRHRAGTVVAAGCAVVGGWVGGKVGGEVGKGANWVGDHVFGWLP